MSRPPPPQGRRRRLGPLLPLALAPLLAWLGGLGPLASAALLGAAAWLAMRMAGRAMPLAFAALALFGGVVFGFTAAVFAALHGVSVHELLALPFGVQPVGIALAWVAVVLAALGVCSGTVAMLRPPAEPDDAQAQPPADEGGEADATDARGSRNGVPEPGGRRGD